MGTRRINNAHTQTFSPSQPAAVRDSKEASDVPVDVEVLVAVPEEEASSEYDPELSLASPAAAVVVRDVVRSPPLPASSPAALVDAPESVDPVSSPADELLDVVLVAELPAEDALVSPSAVVVEFEEDEVPLVDETGLPEMMELARRVCLADM